MAPYAFIYGVYPAHRTTVMEQRAAGSANVAGRRGRPCDSCPLVTGLLPVRGTGSTHP